MDKDAYYFPHFCNARHDRKIKRVIKELGIEGYGIYFMLLETLREQTDMRYPLDEIDLLADEFGTSEAKVRTVVCNYQLFDVDEEHNFFSPKLILYLQPYFERSERARNANKVRWSKQKLLTNDPNGIQMDSTQNPCKNPSKVKESKVKESRSSSDDDDFKKVVGIFNQNIHSITQIEAEKLGDWLNDMSADVIVSAITEAVTHNARSMKYIETILRDWFSKGIKTIIDLESLKKDPQPVSDDSRDNELQEYLKAARGET